MELLREIGYVVLFLVVGSALRYLLPYIMLGLVEVGLERPWPEWKWKYLSAFALAIIGFAIPMVTMPGFFLQLVSMAPIGLIAFAYAGNEMSREVVKAIQRLMGKEEPD